MIQPRPYQEDAHSMSQLILPRRSFLTGLASLLAAPAVVRADALMPVHNIDHLLYPVRGVGYYFMERDELVIRVDRANFPLEVRPKHVQYILSEREIAALFTRNELKSLIPQAKQPTQLSMAKPFSTHEWMAKVLFPRKK